MIAQGIQGTIEIRDTSCRVVRKLAPFTPPIETTIPLKDIQSVQFMPASFIWPGVFSIRTGFPLIHMQFKRKQQKAFEELKKELERRLGL